jgi:tRNA(Arg) A34 adenosine deaminase TadA
VDIKAIIPHWLNNYSLSPRYTYEGFMEVAVDLSRENVAQGTGGPFGAAIFNTNTGMPIALGVNLVVAHHCSILHAEIVAIISAQHVLQSYALQGPYLLASSAEPCAMCLGALPWSGISELVFGAHASDVEEIGFDEGCKPESWQQALAVRNIAVHSGVNRIGAQGVLQQYKRSGAIIYNGKVRKQGL